MANQKLTAIRVAKPYVAPIADADLFYTVQDTGTTPEDRAITGLELRQGLGMADGWVSVSSTWTYLSATSVTVPAGALLIYSIGDKIKFTQTTVKYFYVVGVADTVLTLTGGTDYAVVNAAISAVGYSKAGAPVGFPSFLNWNSTTGHNVQGASSVANDSFNFQINGRAVFCRAYVNCTSNASTMTGTLPVTPAATSIHVVRIRDNTTTYQAGLATITSSSGTVAYSVDTGAGTWTTSNTKGLQYAAFWYSI